MHRACRRPPARAAFETELGRLRDREKAHTREGDAIAAARRRLPMVEVDASTELIGPDGPLTLLDAFEGRRQLIAYYFMWHPGQPAAGQCEGCTWNNTQVAELSYLYSRGITYAVFCQGPYDESSRYRDFMGWDLPWHSAQASLDTLLAGRRIATMHLVCYVRDGDRVFETYWTTRRSVEAVDYSYALMDLTVYGRQEPWEDSPPAGHNSAPTRGLAAARPLGNQCGRADAPSPSGRASKPDALTTSSPGPDRRWSAVLPGAERCYPSEGSAALRAASGHCSSSVTRVQIHTHVLAAALTIRR
jgi:predicted dithiol-disulfide oxidoreductase (DUF899 family)